MEDILPMYPQTPEQLRAAADAAEQEAIKGYAQELADFLKERNIALCTVQQILCVDGQPQFGPMQIQLVRPKQQQQR